MRQRYVVGNWKLNGSRASNAALLDACVTAVSSNVSISDAAKRATLAVCAPYPYLQQLEASLSGSAVNFGSQDVSAHVSGAYTGEVSAAMVAEFGGTIAIVGHSERRALFADSDARVVEKFGRAQAAGLKPILCVGESLQQREAGQTESVVATQLQAVMSAHGVAALADAILAYEPVWAIGTGKTATPAEAQAVHAFLRGLVAKQDERVAAGLSILYGGSVKPSNAAELFAQADIDGGLIGGASLVASDFLAIWRALLPA
jgi:triosephosphate isomerase (TIM)